MELLIRLPSPPILLVILIVATILVRRVFTRPLNFYPPGPRPLPFIGNLLDIPTSFEWRDYSKWKRRWGDIMSLSVYGKRIIIISSLETAIDLLDKRSVHHSDRPIAYTADKLIGWDQTLMRCPYNSHFRRMRKALHRRLGSPGQMEKMDVFRDQIESEAREFLLRILKDPGNFRDHIHKTVGATILRIGYGYNVTEGKDLLVETIERAMDGHATASVPGAFLVDRIPALTWIPKWFPGMAWKETIANWKADLEVIMRTPYKKVKAMNGCTSGINLIRDGISQEPFYEEDEYSLTTAVASLYPGGIDKTQCVLSNFFLAMVLYPGIQKKAQRELDYIVGVDRLPCLSDRDRLPYINAICTELHRWNPVTPLGIPHTSSVDDFFQGYFIPRGSLLLVNVWHIMRDPEVYSEPLLFKPERFMGEEGKAPEHDPRPATLGFGKRVCPGANLAEAMLFVICARTLAVFDISTATEDGQEIIPSVLHGPGTVSHPLLFRCQIRPRSSNAELLIRKG